MTQNKAQAIVVNETESASVCAYVYRVDPVSSDEVCGEGTGGTQPICSSSGVVQLWWCGCAKPLLQR